MYAKKPEKLNAHDAHLASRPFNCPGSKGFGGVRFLMFWMPAFSEDDRWSCIRSSISRVMRWTRPSVWSPIFVISLSIRNSGCPTSSAMALRSGDPESTGCDMLTSCLTLSTSPAIVAAIATTSSLRSGLIIRCSSGNLTLTISLVIAIVEQLDCNA